MTTNLRWLITRLNSNYWFYPALFSLVATALAVVMLWLDRLGFSQALSAVTWLQPARPQSASNMLTTIAGSTIGVVSTVFSITIAAVAYASGNYGPRLLTNFMEDKGNQLSLATFIGTFVYAVIVLRTVRQADEPASSGQTVAYTAAPGFVPQLSLLVAYVLMALSVAVLVYLLNHIPSSIRINTVLRGIGERFLRDIRDNYEINGVVEETPPPPAGRSLTSQTTGYIQIIDFAELSDLADRESVSLALMVRTGDFVHPGVEIARLIEGDMSDGLSQSVEKAFGIGATRTPSQDPQFLIDELVEIALRALSPGINDPFTAITAMHWLGAATAELGRRDLRRRCEDHPERTRVQPLRDPFAHFVTRGFGMLRGAAATNTPAALVMLDTLANAASPITSEERRTQLREQGKLLLEQARLALDGPDLASVEDRYRTFTQAF